jgi:protein-arginine kinase activator protein McsA
MTGSRRWHNVYSDTGSTLNISPMIRQLKELVFDFKFKFPLPKNQYGFYNTLYTQTGHNLRCPNCGGSTWSIKSYQHLECTTCYRNFSNLGVLGLQEI